jgi:hypothetical protein
VNHLNQRVNPVVNHVTHVRDSRELSIHVKKGNPSRLDLRLCWLNFSKRAFDFSKVNIQGGY